MKKEETIQATYDLMSRLYLSEDEKNYAYNKLTQKRFWDTELKVTEVDRGIILPCRPYSGGVCTENFEFVAGHSLARCSDGSSSNFAISKSYTVSQEELEHIDETVVFGGIMHDHPGHLILEGIASRMWWHLKNPDSKLRFVVLNIWGHHDKLEFIKEFLDLLGVPEERLFFLSKPTQFTKVLVPDQAVYPRDTFTKEYMLVFDKIKDNVTPGKYKKIFFTKNSKNDIVNQEYFVDFFSKKGFEIIDPEKYTLREKVSFMKGAKEFAACGGTNCIYTIFCDEDTKLFVLGRANDPVAEQYITYEAKIKDMYIIDVCLNLLHKDRVWGINLVGPTKYWRQFVQDFYHENIKETQEDIIKACAYEYLKRCAEYYSDPFLFNYFKGFSHFQIINLMNKVFFDKELDPGKYDTSTVESTARIFSNALDFCFELNLDNKGIRKFDRFMNKLSGCNIAILKQQDKAAVILKKLADINNVNITYLSNQPSLYQLTPEELENCKKADVVISCCVHGTKTHERDGVKCIDIWDILRDDSLTADLPALPETRCIEMESELKHLSDELVEQSKSLSMVYAACKDSSAEKMLREEINILHTDKEQLREELGRSTAEQNMLNEHIRRINADKDSLNNTVLKLTQEKSLLDIRLHEIQSSVDALESAKKSSADELARISKMLEDEQSANSTAMLKINELTVQNAELAESKHRFEFEIAALNGEINSLNGQNNDLVKKKAELEHRSEELSARIDILNSQKAELTNVAANLTAETENLNKTVDELNDTNSRLSAECIQAMQLYDDEKKANLAAAKSVDTLTSEKDSMSKRIRELETMLKEEQSKAAELDNELENMKNSRSWKITKPIRNMSDRFKRKDN